MSQETSEIQLECPICKETHKYALSISTSAIFYHMTANMDTSPKPKRFRRVFTCPKRGRNFKATVTLKEHFGEMIDDVTIK